MVAFDIHGEVAAQRLSLTRTASLQLFPIELSPGLVTACVGLAAGAELPSALALRVEPVPATLSISSELRAGKVVRQTFLVPAECLWRLQYRKTFS